MTSVDGRFNGPAAHRLCCRARLCPLREEVLFSGGAEPM